MIGAIVTLISLALFGQSLFSLYLMLYSWEHPERLAASRGPRSYLPPRLSFTVLLPARHEEAVIRETIKRVWAANYPAALLEIAVICHADDAGTIAEARGAIAEIGSPRVRVETFAGGPINKPRGLNVGLARTANEVVTIFDAEDDIDPEIFNVVNTTMLEEEVGIVQAGVQLMNFRDHWFAVHNCLEYFFWFKSRLHFHARVGMIPLGGNTVFIRRPLIARVGGWDEGCLTEDADIGIRLSVLGEPIRVVYDAARVTREETPDSVEAFVKQRTRWLQGFLQVLRKGEWRELPRFGQRLLAAYTLSYPLFQALLMLLWPVTIATIIWLKLSTLVALVSFLPLYALLFQLLANVVGAVMFAREYEERVPLWLPLGMLATFLPFQWLLGVSAIRGVYRELRRETSWEKTAHLGAHRQPAGSGGTEAVLSFDALLREAGHRLGVQRGSVLLLDPAERVYTIAASRGLPPEVVVSTRVAPGEGVAGWVAASRRPLIVDGRALPTELAGRMHRPEVGSAVLLPLEHRGMTVGVLSIASTSTPLGDEALLWLQQRVGGVLLEGRLAANGYRNVLSDLQSRIPPLRASAPAIHTSRGSRTWKLRGGALALLLLLTLGAGSAARGLSEQRVAITPTTPRPLVAISAPSAQLPTALPVPTSIALAPTPSAAQLMPLPTSTVAATAPISSVTSTPPLATISERAATAEAQIRSGQFELAIDYGNGITLSSTVWFDLGEAVHPTSIHVVSLYHGNTGTRRNESIAIGGLAWQREDSDPWSVTTAPTNVPAHMLPGVSMRPTLSPLSDPHDGMLIWRDENDNTDVALQVDPASGVPQQLQRVSPSLGLIVTVTYSGWNVPVQIVPPPMSSVAGLFQPPPEAR